MGPTGTLGIVASESGGVWVHEDGVAPAAVLTLHPEKAKAAGLSEVATIMCRAVSDGVAIVGSGVAHIDETGTVSPPGTTTISVVGVADRTQLSVRPESVKCTIESGSRTQEYNIAVTVYGNVEPSYRLFCPVADGVEPADVLANYPSCSTELTTNGNRTLVVIGGNCETCPQPPFDATTVMYVGGIAMRTTLLPGGRILTRSPTIAELLNGADEATFDFTYYNFSIASFGDPAYGTRARGGSVGVGLHDGPSACEKRGHCPAHSRIFYTSKCLGFVDVTDPTETRKYDNPDDSAAQLFAYGTPLSGCRACPTGCRCPGGDRCETVKGYFLPCADGADAARCQSLEDMDEPLACHADIVIAAKRCDGFDGDRSVCVDGATGLLCGECLPSWYSENGVCMECQSDEAAYEVIGYIAIVFTATFLTCFVLVAIVQGYYGNSIQSGGIRSLNFASWICSALATQAQIGRTSGGNQPELLEGWYRLLKLFEFNPDGARPMECSGSVSSVSIAALSVGIALPLLFMLLALPFLQKWLVDVLEKLFAPVVGAIASAKSKAAAKKELGASPRAEEANGVEVSATAVNERASDPAMMSNPLHGGRRLSTRMRAETQRAEVELVLMSPHQRKSTLALTMLQRDLTPQRASFVREAMSSNRTSTMLLPSKIGDGDAALLPTDATNAMDLVVENKRERLSQLFVARRDTIFAAWQLEKLAAEHERALAERSEVREGEKLSSGSGIELIVLNSEDTVGADSSGDRLWAQSNEPDKKQACCRKKAKKKRKRKKLAKTPRQHAEWVVGNVRKVLLATTVLLHPMIVNSAFKSIYCTPHPQSGALVVASSPGVQCFVGSHWVVFVLSVLAIIVEVIALPIFIVFALGTSASWWSHCGARAPEPTESETEAVGVGRIIDSLEDADAFTKALEKYGQVNSGLCCRSMCCIDCLVVARRSFVTRHSKHVDRVRSLSYAAFTFNDYKPEFFFVRLLYVCGNTLVAACNGFLDPLLVLTVPPWVRTDADRLMLLAGLQAARFVICVGVTIVPVAVLLMLLPNKNGSRWKMPLRMIFALLSLGMLALNAFSWGVEKVGASPGIVEANQVLSYAVLGLSMLTLAVMAACFVVFVVFRGAKEDEIKAQISDAAVEAEELALLARAVIGQNQTMRAFAAWRKVVRPTSWGGSDSDERSGVAPERTSEFAADGDVFVIPVATRGTPTSISALDMAKSNAVPSTRAARRQQRAERAWADGEGASAGVATKASPTRAERRKLAVVQRAAASVDGGDDGGAAGDASSPSRSERRKAAIAKRKAVRGQPRDRAATESAAPGAARTRAELRQSRRDAAKAEAGAREFAVPSPARAAAAMQRKRARSNAAERRIGPNGESRTRAEFRKAFGNLSAWREAEPELRIAPDGYIYDKADFVKHYGGLAEWIVGPSEERVGADGFVGTKVEFYGHHRPDVAAAQQAWAAATLEERMAPDGHIYTKARFVHHFGGVAEWVAAPSPAAAEGGADAPDESNDSSLY